ncbi:hypothetical protein SKAU_G00320290 [Synaphobranchus kaupii]|uniref:Seizure protein 6 n=1 Tax=Synaphobranchus kaupii TaxID=118154 RepID=A0A9Q1ENI7_SYNKA|nr:hypothetical protein SKAU_G00320290 [Synaphobranchus kaupii]
MCPQEHQPGAHLPHTWQHQPLQTTAGIGSLAEEVDAGRSQYSPTHSSEGEVHVTTVTPVHILNHHPALFMGFSRHQDPAPKEEDSIPTPTSPLGGRSPAHLLPQRDTPTFYDITSTTAATPPIITTETPNPELLASVVPEGVASNSSGRSSDALPPMLGSSPSAPAHTAHTGEQPAGPEAIAMGTSLASSFRTSAREAGVATRQRMGVEWNTGPTNEVTAMTLSSSGDIDEKTTTTTTTIISTTIITTIQSPVPCSTNLTAPEGYMEVPPAPAAWSHPSLDCTFTVTVYMGYGVEIQVLNVSLSEGETVRLEDLGGQEPAVVANESILMKGLVVRSRSNQIAVRFQSERSLPGSFLLRYQVHCLPCPLSQSRLSPADTKLPGVFTVVCV